jgi:hypothetical protein
MDWGWELRLLQSPLCGAKTKPSKIAPRDRHDEPDSCMNHYAHAYRMKVSRSGIFLTLAALLMLVGIRVAARGFVRIDIPMAPLRVVTGALLALFGAFMVAMVLRSRFVIEDSQIRFRIIFREEVFPVSDIKGFRTVTTGPASHRVSRRVLCVNGRKEPIEVVQFEGDQFLQTWVKQFPNLDHPEQTGSAQSHFPKGSSTTV